MTDPQRLDEVATIIMGQAPPGESYNTDGHGWPLIAGAGDFQNGRAVTKKYASKATKVSQPGDIVLSIRASIGDKISADDEYCLGRGVAAIRANMGVDPRFLWHWLNSVTSELANKGKGATFKQVNRSDIGELPITLPPLEEQRRITGILDRANTLRTIRRQTITLLEDLAQSIFFDTFGSPLENPRRYPVKTLKDMVPFGDRINYGVIQPGADVNNGIPLIRVGNLVNGRVVHDSIKRISPVIESKYRRSRIRGNEILVGCVGSIGMVALASPGEVGFNIARAVSRIPLESAAERRFVAEYLRTAPIQRYFHSELRTVAQPTLNIKQLSETEIFIPPVELIERFALQVEAIDRFWSIYTSQLLELDNLAASLQARAFRGEL